MYGSNVLQVWYFPTPVFSDEIVCKLCWQDKHYICPFKIFTENIQMLKEILAFKTKKKKKNDRTFQVCKLSYGV